MATLTKPIIMGNAEARRKLSAILENFRTHGLHADPVYIGSYRRPEALIIPAELAEMIAPILEDILIAERARVRIGEAYQPVDRDDMVSRLGLDEDAISAETATVLAQLNTNS